MLAVVPEGLDRHQPKSDKSITRQGHVKSAEVRKRTNSLLRKSSTSLVVDGPPMFRKTIAVGPSEPVASCVTGGTAVAKPDLRHLLYPRKLLPNRTELALLRKCRGRAEGQQRVITRGHGAATHIKREDVYDVQQGDGREEVDKEIYANHGISPW